MSKRTISELNFEKLCAIKGVVCERIPESHIKTADYRVSLGEATIITEVKQLDPNDEDKKLSEVWGTPQSPGTVTPSDRVQGLLNDGYSQIKRSSEGKWPAIIVVYNNSGSWNWIDKFTVTKAMFGSYGIVLGLKPDQTIHEIGRGYLGQRKVTKDSFRSLSAVGVLEYRGSGVLEFSCYHNPFASIPIRPSVLATLANVQYIHPNPHERGFIPWKPKRIENITMPSPRTHFPFAALNTNAPVTAVVRRNTMSNENRQGTWDPNEVGPSDKCIKCFTPYNDDFAFCSFCGHVSTVFDTPRDASGEKCHKHRGVQAIGFCCLCAEPICDDCKEKEHYSIAGGFRHVYYCRSCVRKAEDIKNELKKKQRSKDSVQNITILRHLLSV